MQLLCIHGYLSIAILTAAYMYLTRVSYVSLAMQYSVVDMMEHWQML